MKRRINANQLLVLLGLGGASMAIAALGPAGIVEMLAQGFSGLMLLGIFYGLIGLAFDKNVCSDCGTRWR